MKSISTVVYEADDGTRFNTEAECLAHEKAVEEKAKRTTYWVVAHTPDLTEGRGFYGRMYIECYGPEPYNAEMYMRDWCFRVFDRPIAFVMGVAATENWRLAPSTHKEFLAKRPAQVGDYKHEATSDTLVIGEKEKGLVRSIANPKVAQL